MQETNGITRVTAAELSCLYVGCSYRGASDLGSKDSERVLSG